MREPAPIPPTPAVISTVFSPRAAALAPVKGSLTSTADPSAPWGIVTTNWVPSWTTSTSSREASEVPRRAACKRVATPSMSSALAKVIPDAVAPRNVTVPAVMAMVVARSDTVPLPLTTVALPVICSNALGLLPVSLVGSLVLIQRPITRFRG